MSNDFDTRSPSAAFDLPMPSDVRKAATDLDKPAIPATSESPPAPNGDAAPARGGEVVAEPPSAKLIVRLFLIPLLIVALAVGVMFLIGLLAGGEPSFDDAITGLGLSGGQRTGGVLVGPASKQRYMYAKALADKMKAGLSEAERVQLAGRLVDVVDKARLDEGDVKYFLLLALGRVWQADPSQGPMNTPAAAASRRQVVAKLLSYFPAAPVPAGAENERRAFEQQQVRVRKAAVLALVYLAGTDESRAALGPLIAKLNDTAEDLDVRMAAATVLGRLATPLDADVIAALRAAKDRTDKKEEIELVWDAALSLAQLHQSDAAPEVMKLLDRNELARVEVLDRETDPKNPTFQKLSEQERERILINAMIGASALDLPEVQAQIRKIAETDPSSRVREAGREVVERKKAAGR